MRARHAPPVDSPVSAGDFPALRPLLGYTLRMLDLRLMRAISAELAPLGLTPAAATLLIAVADHPGIALGRLADALVVQHPNMTKLVRRLEGQGLLSREARSGDRRRIALVVTAAGQALGLRARAAFARQDGALAAMLTRDERATLLALARRMLAAQECMVDRSLDLQGDDQV